MDTFGLALVLFGAWTLYGASKNFNPIQTLGQVFTSPKDAAATIADASAAGASANEAAAAAVQQAKAVAQSTADGSDDSSAIDSRSGVTHASGSTEYVQIKPYNNAHLSGSSKGRCLQQVRKSFYIGGKYPTALSAWAAAKHKHKNEAPPKGVIVPMFFTTASPAGHVDISVNGTSEVSTGFNSSTVTWTGTPPMYQKHDKHGKYLGWTEDLDGVRIVKPK